MKKTIKTISLLLAVSLCLSLFGCDYINEWMGKNGEQNVGESDDVVLGNHSYHELFPDGYTGGFHHQPGANIEYWWVETYEEAIEAIELLENRGRLSKLNGELRYTATLRLENPSASLSELALLHDPPISKSGLNRRLLKILEEADAIKETDSH
jgi:hypothetical protein